MDRIENARRVFDLEIEALKKTRDSLDDTFLHILELIINCEGKVIVTGMGKPGHIAKKIAATFSSLGTPAFYMHPAEAMHGDLGMISEKDVVIVISFSGESEEIIHILPNVKMLGATIVGITGNEKSTLGKVCDVVQILPPFKEACCMGLAPTSSTTVELCYGDALAVVASEIYGFQDVDFGKFHPAGALGKKIILRVNDLMTMGDENAKIDSRAKLKDAIVELSRKGKGLVSIIDEEGLLVGVITDGDLRRQLENGVDIYALMVRDIMTENPITINKSKMAVEALNLLKENNIMCLPVVEDGKPIGLITLQDITGAGIVG